MATARNSSEVNSFPYGFTGKLCYIEHVVGKPPEQVAGRPALREALRRATCKDSTLYAAWPGQYRTDLFLIDRLDLLAAAIL